MNPYAEPLAWALVNFVWQGAALALAAFLGFAPAQACSSDTAIAMAQSARARAARLVPSTGVGLGTDLVGPDLVGLGATAALVSDRPRKGEHRFHIAFANSAGIAHCTCVLAKGRRDRAAPQRPERADAKNRER